MIGNNSFEKSDRHIKYIFMVKGIQYFQKVVFAKIPKYTPSIAQKNCVNYVRLLNYGNNIKFKELANWIESQPIWNTVPEKILTVNWRL